MKKSKVTESQIVFAIKQSETVPVEEVSRKLGVSQATFYSWKKRYGGLDVTELRRLRQLEEENAKLKQIVADLSLDKKCFRTYSKKALRPAQKRALALDLNQDYKAPLSRCISLMMMHPSSFYYRNHRRDDGLLRQFVSDQLQQWCRERGIHLQFIQPGKPVQNAFVGRNNS